MSTPGNVGKHESGCQINELFRLLGESYVLDLLYVFLSDGQPKRFLDLQDRLKMSPNTLTDRLRGLVTCGLLTRTAFSEIPPRVEYQATTKARELQVVFGALQEWAARNNLKPIAAATRR